MKWRTIPEAMKEITKHDPNTVLTEKGIRKMAKEQEIKSMKNGRVTYVDLEELGGSRCSKN